MGGKILDYEAKTILREGIQQDILYDNKEFYPKKRRMSTTSEDITKENSILDKN